MLRQFLKNLNEDGSLGLGLSDISDTIPVSIQLNQNHPNPFNPSTDIEFSLPDQQHALLEVFDTRGRPGSKDDIGTVTNKKNLC